MKLDDVIFTSLSNIDIIFHSYATRERVIWKEQPLDEIPLINLGRFGELNLSLLM